MKFTDIPYFLCLFHFNKRAKSHCENASEKPLWKYFFHSLHFPFFSQIFLNIAHLLQNILFKVIFTCKLSICYQQFLVLYVLANSRDPVSDSIIPTFKIPLDLFFKDALSSLRQFLAIDDPLKMMKNPFYFILKLFSFSSYLNFCLEFLAIS